MITKKETYLSTTIISTKLFLDDIEKIISKLKNEDLEVEISDNENIYESIKELIEIKGKSPKLIKIEGKKKDKLFEYISVRITESSSSIYVASSESLLKVGLEIEKLLTSKKRKSIYSFFNSLTAKINIILNSILALITFILNKITDKISFSYIIWVYIIIFWAIIYLISELNPNSNTKIELERKHELNFYEKHKEKIILGLIMAILGSLITLIVKYFSNK